METKSYSSDLSDAQWRALGALCGEPCPMTFHLTRACMTTSGAGRSAGVWEALADAGPGQRALCRELGNRGGRPKAIRRRQKLLPPAAWGMAFAGGEKEGGQKG